MLHKNFSTLLYYQHVRDGKTGAQDSLNTGATLAGLENLLLFYWQKRDITLFA